MKITILNQYNMPPEYGHLNRHYNLAKYLSKMGHEVTVIVGSKLHNTNIQMIKGKNSYLKYQEKEFDYFFSKTCDYGNSKFKRVIAMFQYNRNAMKIIKKMKHQDVILGSSAHPLAAYLAIRIAHKQKAISIVEVRDLWPESIVAYNILSKNNPLVKLMYFFEHWLYAKSNRLIFTMEGGIDYIKEKGWNIAKRLQVDLSKIYHINNGIDLNVYLQNIKDFNYCDSELDNKEVFKIVYVGSIRRVNRLDILLDIAKNISYVNIKFYIFGSGDYVESFLDRINSENIQNVFYKGFVDKKFIPSILSKSNLNIITGESIPLFRYGGSMNKLFDYFASGIPVLTTFKINYSLIERYNAGIEFDVLNYKNIARKIELLSIDKKLLKTMHSGAQIAATDYDFSKLASKLDDCIKGIKENNFV